MAGAQDDFDTLSALAERLGLDEDESHNFVSSSMKRLGYKAREMWEDGDGDSKSGSGDFFGKKREERPARRQRSGDRWSQYG